MLIMRNAYAQMILLSRGYSIRFHPFAATKKQSKQMMEIIGYETHSFLKMCEFNSYFDFINQVYRIVPTQVGKNAR